MLSDHHVAVQLRQIQVRNLARDQNHQKTKALWSHAVDLGPVHDHGRVVDPEKVGVDREAVADLGKVEVDREVIVDPAVEVDREVAVHHVAIVDPAVEVDQEVVPSLTYKRPPNDLVMC